MRPVKPKQKATPTTLRLAWLVALAAWAVTCQSHRYFDVVQDMTALLGAGQSADGLSFVAVDGGLNLDQSPSFSRQGLNIGSCNSITLRELSLAVTEPGTGQGLTFLGPISITLTARGHAPVVVASGAAQNDGTNLWVLTPGNQELLPLFQAGGVSAQLVAAQSEQAPQDLNLQASFSLNLQIKEPASACTN